ncbi:aminopeptidase [Thecaphora frezii]
MVARLRQSCHLLQQELSAASNASLSRIAGPSSIQRRASSASAAAKLADDLPRTGYPSTSSSTASCSYKPLSRRSYGQPLPHSHPHLFPRRGPLGNEDLVAYPSQKVGLELLDPGEGLVATDQLTPGIPASEYESRRRRLMERLPDGSIAVLFSGRVKSMSGNIFYKFRQESNFWYLTGFQEPDSAVLLEKDASSSKGYKMTMYVPPRDDHNETWNGPRTGVDGATEVFGADEAHDMDPTTLLTHLKQMLPGYTHIYVDSPTQPSVPRRSSGSRTSTAATNVLNYLSPPSTTGFDLFSKKSDFDHVARLLGDPRRCHALSREVERLRFKKSANELRVMRRAGRISGEAMAEVMRYVEPGKSEAQLQAVFEYHCAINGAQRPAYVPVVAGGSNALTIHYINNDRLVDDASLVCIDAGCELDGYASDITRAFPTSLNGSFTGAQRDLYEAVLNVLKGCTALATEDQCYTLADLHRRSVDMLRAELKQLGFHLTFGTLERILYPHYIGHWLGIDLHDVASIDRSTRLERGVVVTVEPGVYVPYDDRFPKHFHGIGIRIEDDVAVGESDNVVLSAEAPKEVVDVEAACAVHAERIERRRSQLVVQPAGL